MVPPVGLVQLIATAGLATDAPDEGSGPTRRGWARLQRMSGSRVQVARPPLGRWSSSRRPCSAWPGLSVTRPLGGCGGQTAGRSGLGIVSSHTVRVLDEQGQVVCRRRCEPTVESLGRVEAAALAGTPAGTVLEVVMEPTGPAW